MDYVKFLPTEEGEFPVISGSIWSGIDENYMIDDWRVWSGAEGDFPEQEISSFLCSTEPLDHMFMSEEEINDYTTYSGGE